MPFFLIFVCCSYFAVLILMCFYLKKGCIMLFYPETIILRVLHLMVFICKFSVILTTVYLCETYCPIWHFYDIIPYINQFKIFLTKINNNQIHKTLVLYFSKILMYFQDERVISGRLWLTSVRTLNNHHSTKLFFIKLIVLKRPIE